MSERSLNMNPRDDVTWKALNLVLHSIDPMERPHSYAATCDVMTRIEHPEAPPTPLPTEEARDEMRSLLDEITDLVDSLRNRI